MRRRNSLRLEHEVYEQEKGPWRSYGIGYNNYSSSNINQRTKDIKNIIDFDYKNEENEQYLKQKQNREF